MTIYINLNDGDSDAMDNAKEPYAIALQNTTFLHSCIETFGR